MALFEPYRANEFVLEIQGIETPTVSKVSGLSMGETDTIDVVEGGTNVVHKISSGKVKFQPLTVERYVDGSKGDADFKAFFESMFQLNGASAGSTARKDGAVVKKHFGKEVLRFAFYGAWVRSSAFSDLEAGSTNVLKQTVVLEHDGLELVLTGG